MTHRVDKEPVFPLEGRAAEEYRDAYLVQASEPDADWNVPYRHKETGEPFVMEHPDADYHGGGTPRLRRIE